MTGDVGSPPLPRFTIEELLREAVEAIKEDEQCVFTTKDLAGLWGYRALNSARRQMDVLTERGWKFIVTRKDFVNRAGNVTSTHAYIVVPPAGNDADDSTDAEDNLTSRRIT